MARIVALLSLCISPAFLPQACAVVNFTGGTHTDSATITLNSVVESNPSFTTTGAVSTNPVATATHTTPAPTTQDAASSVSASFDGISIFTASFTASASGNRPTSSGNSEIAVSSSTFTFTLTSPMNFQLSGNSAASVMGAGSSSNFFVTLSQQGNGIIATNGDVFGPFLFSGTLQPGNYTMAASIEANGFPGSTNPTITASGSYTLALVPEPSTGALMIAGGVVFLLALRVAARSRKSAAS